MVLALGGALVAPAAAGAAVDWTQRGTAVTGTAMNDALGMSTALSADGSVLAVGAPQIGVGSGFARTYAWVAGAWQVRGAAVTGQASGDDAGVAVALSADGAVMAVGAHQNDTNGTNSGQVRVYAWDGTAWTQRGLPMNGEAANDGAGKVVSLSADGTVLAIGAQNNDGNGSNSGQVRVYAWNGSAWQQRGADIDGEAAGDLFGAALQLAADGATLAVGANQNDGGGSNAGSARVFAWSGPAWVQRGQDVDGQAAGDTLTAVALSADATILATGANGNSDVGFMSGKVRVFSWSGSAWVQRGTALLGEGAGDQFGGTVALSRSGSVLAVGAYGRASSTGRVRTFAWSGSAWTQRGSAVDGTAAGNVLGVGLSLTPDGTMLSVGAYGYMSGSLANAGQARVYSWDGPADGGSGGGSGSGGGGSGSGSGSGDAGGTGGTGGASGAGTSAGAVADDPSAVALAAESTPKTAGRPRAVPASTWVRRAVRLLHRGTPRATLNATLDGLRAGTVSRAEARVIIRRDVLAVREGQIEDLPGIGRAPRPLRRAERLLRRSLVLSAKADRAYVEWLDGDPGALARAITMGLLATDAKERLVPLLSGRGVAVPAATGIWP